MAPRIVHMLDTADTAGNTAEAGKLLASGGVVLLPTETVYGFAALLTSQPARDRLRALKPTAPSLPPAPLTLHLGHRQQAERFLGPLGEFPQRLIRRLWPGPVGLIFHVEPDRRREVAASLGVAESEIYSPDGTLTLRCPDHPVARDVILAAGAPVVLTQAPTAGAAPAQRLSDIPDAAIEQADLVLSAGPTRFSRPSTLLRVHADRYDLVRAGVYDDRILQRMLKTTVLFVCSGNTCRSPMAMALTRKLLAEKLGVSEAELEARGIAVLSAGTYAMAGAKATPQAVDAVRDLGADLSRHRSKPLTPELIHQADVIYTMGRSHRAAVLALAPGSADKVLTLSPDQDIEDPIGSDVSVYRGLARTMVPLIEKRLQERPVT
jgi:protein-tyrosine phosphatase